MWFKYSDTNTVSDVKYLDSDTDGLKPSKRIRSRIRSENIRTIFILVVGSQSSCKSAAARRWVGVRALRGRQGVVRKGGYMEPNCLKEKWRKIMCLLCSKSSLSKKSNTFSFDGGNMMFQDVFILQIFLENFCSTFVVIWQNLSNHGLTRLKRFVSTFTDKLYN
jgi:hypothetical protein